MSSMIGEKAPDFSLSTSDGEEFNFSDLEAVSYTHLTLPTICSV